MSLSRSPLPTSLPSTAAASLRRWVSVAIVCVPIAYAAVRAAAGGWVPSGDDAYFTIRSRDVLTRHHPLLGAWSSGSVDLEHPINNLGPLQHDLLAPFTRWTPMGGTAIAVGLINIVCIVTIAWLVRRTAGQVAVLPAMAVVGLLTWTMGSEMLITPRQHQFLILPYLCLLVAAWAVATGDRWALIVAVVTASLVAQTHLSYPVLVAALAIVMLVGHVATTASGQASSGGRPLVTAAVVAVLLWMQTLIDQFAGFGNLGDVLTGSGESGNAGWSVAGRLVAAVLVSPDTLFRPGYARNTADEVGLAAGWQVAVMWALIAATALWIVMVGRRRGWVRVAGQTVALVAVLAAIVNAALLPRTRFGLRLFNYRWLWSTGAFVAIVAAVAVVRWWDDTRGIHDRRRRPVLACGLAVCVVPALLNLPRSVQDADADRYLSDQVKVALLLDQLDDSLASNPLDGPVVVDETDMYFGHPYTYPVLVMLQERDVEFRFESQIQERRFGRRRVADGSEPELLRLVAGQLADDAQGDPATLAYVGGDRPVAVLVERFVASQPDG